MRMIDINSLIAIESSICKIPLIHSFDELRMVGLPNPLPTEEFPLSVREGTGRFSNGEINPDLILFIKDRCAGRKLNVGIY